MTKRRLLLVLTILGATLSVHAQGRRNFTKDMRYFHFNSEVMSQERKMLVILPPDYEASKDKRYPVLYMHDGQSVFVNWRIDEIANPLFVRGQVQPVIIVAIFNGDTQEERTNDYTPTRDTRMAQGGKADLYGRMIVEELKPIVDSEFRTLSDQANTAIGGTSFGGLVSIYLALKYPTTFGKAAVMSPSVWWDNGMILGEVKGLGSKPALKIWLDIGTEEGSQSIANTKALRDALLKKGWTKETDLKYFEAKGAEHDEKSFARRAHEVLKYLFPPEVSRKAVPSARSFHTISNVGGILVSTHPLPHRARSALSSTRN